MSAMVAIWNAECHVGLNCQGTWQAVVTMCAIASAPLGSARAQLLRDMAWFAAATRKGDTVDGIWIL